MEDNKPNYFAIIPASVRYDNNLKANEKLLYGEITSLCNSKGYCWATNKYFSELYNVDIATISRWIKSLSDYSYINISYKKDNTRIISIADLLTKKSIPIDEKVNTPIDEKINSYINNNNINNKNNIYDYYINKISDLNPIQYEKLNALIESVGEEKVKQAIDISYENGAKSLNYVIKVANSNIIITNEEESEGYKELFDYNWLDDE